MARNDMPHPIWPFPVPLWPAGSTSSMGLWAAKGKDTTVMSVRYALV